jgi:predicted transposase YbfD/YdcC
MPPVPQRPHSSVSSSASAICDSPAAIPLLLERLELAGALVTIDAIGPQTAIAETIRGRGGDSLLALKANRPLTVAEVETYFADPPPGGVETYQTVDADHGRIETRRHTVCHQGDWLFSDRRYPGEPRFPDLAMIAMVESACERDGRVERERRYSLASEAENESTFARRVKDLRNLPATVASRRGERGAATVV